ncbi:uncharacterized protein EAE97_003913 [Botrytis byssoidea]|uniref:Uncharacterized protein n=1 Tax=Botrytis byssoidea TaxID=139641 RepID=A0A9P5INX4_9HELO|nr:uncharacterized protein EAE97_003913 [Botrytis byssoidea]KAF7948502.1 hypothetical protein EAE97_003913 [Botrytis byssoidea]
MESDIAANSDTVEPVQRFSAYVSPSPPDPSKLERLGLIDLEAEKEETTREFGACRLVPRDGRIELSFHLNLTRFAKWPPTGATIRFLVLTEELKRFSMIKNEHFRFEILDSNLVDSNLVDPAKPILACYKPEEMNVILFEATSTQDRWMRKRQDSAPKWLINQWRRVICCQGLSLVLDPEINYGDLFLCPFPYLNSGFLYGVRNPIEERGSHIYICGLSDVEKELGITGLLNIDEMRGSKSANPYYDLDNGFHIVFYEKIEYWMMPSSESWKTGNLYLKTAGGEVEPFRRSAFTRDIVVQKCMLTAELTSILYAMRLVVKRWEELYQHIEGLLHEDFMDPATYVELLFDDENFSQSRLYFWVTGCVNEFQISIEDNIKQWTLFREARVESYLGRNQVDVSRNNDSSSTSSKMKMGKQNKVLSPAEEIDVELPPRSAEVPKESGSSTSSENLREESQKKINDLANRIDVEVESLINWQSQFKHQQETAQAYRDGLFNASALMESRASTRLGENVKLLTYVSIFYLPLAFCAAL